ncbi:MAG: hypothetical protein AAB225_24860, partial [Acidobacteriota bacterium]
MHTAIRRNLRTTRTASRCSACGARARIVRASYAFTESGIQRVVLQGIELIRCEKCGNEDPIIPRVNDLMRTLACAVVSKPYRLEGQDVRFLRKYVRMTGEEFARLLHVDRTTLSKWENDDDPVGEQSDRLIRMLALGLGEGLKEKRLLSRICGLIPVLGVVP